jgi:hypothetical protein
LEITLWNKGGQISLSTLLYEYQLVVHTMDPDEEIATLAYNSRWRDPMLEDDKHPQFRWVQVRKITDTEANNNLRVFYLKRDNTSNPEVLLITARDLAHAEELLGDQLEKENYSRDRYKGELVEYDTTQAGLLIIRPPGDLHMIH